MVRLCFFSMSLMALCCGHAFSQSSTYVENGSKITVSWEEMAGSIVEVDGVAWGAFEKGLGARVVMPNNTVYLQNLDLNETGLNGRLVRVAGVLRKARIEPAPAGAQGYSQPIDYFYIEAIGVSQIEKLVNDQLLPSDDDWILPGLSSEAALKLVADRKFDAYPLALAAAPDGSTSHSFRVAEGTVLAYRVLNGNVISTSQINLNGVGKLDDEWTQLPGFRLPSASNRR